MNKEEEKEETTIDKLRNGELIEIGNGVYAMCQECGAIVKINKFIFGGLHICK